MRTSRIGSECWRIPFGRERVASDSLFLLLGKTLKLPAGTATGKQPHFHAAVFFVYEYI